MALKKIRLGDYIIRSTKNNHNLEYGADLIVGVTNDGVFANPRGDNKDVNLKPYKVVNNGAFVYNPSRLNVGSIAYRTEGLCIVSHLYQIFYLTDEGKKIIDPEWLFIYFRRQSFYREVTFRNFGSQRPEFNFNDMSEIIIPLPDIDLQKKYAAIYNSMMQNLKSYENGLDDLRLVFNGFIENIRRSNGTESIKPFLIERCETNKNGDDLIQKGVGLKGFIEPNQTRTKESLKRCNIFYKGDFVYAPSSFKNGVISYNDKYEKAICTEEYVVFYINNLQKLNPYYLEMWLKRSELGRSIDFYVIDSVRNRFYFENMDMIKIPIPDIKLQDSIASIYREYLKRINFRDEMKKMILDICPILIRGSIMEAEGGN